MASQRPKFTIQVNGADGDSAYMEYSYRPRGAPKYQDGVDGRPAREAGAGGAAGHLSVQLSASTVARGGIHVEGTGAWQGRSWEISPGHDIFLSARGGTGGKGGKGEDGQDGGRGQNGEDATRWTKATPGQRGMDGGRGGYGSSGANGGDGGTIDVAVKEEDMHLLSAVSWDVDGGDGGAAGAHGSPGRAGSGGRGGSAYHWTEEITEVRMVDDGHGGLTPQKHKDVVFRTHAEASNGNSGRPGSPLQSTLHKGRPGRAGTFSFFVVRENGAREQYHGCYNLQVYDFEMVDENDDGIYEPGEHVLIKNIKIHNTGVMPSPSLTDIPLAIRSGPLLNGNVQQDRLYIPTSIPPGHVWKAQGYLKALVKQEEADRIHLNEPFVGEDVINVIATMPGINRPLDDFQLRSPLTIQYPLELLQPAYRQTVLIGDEFTVHWRIRNISRKAYGIDSSPSRLCATCIYKKGSFTLKPPVENDSCVHYAQLIEPGEEEAFRQVLCVSDSAVPFSRGNVHLEMLLGEPGDNSELFNQAQPLMSSVRLLAKFDLDIQISQPYKHTYEAYFLILVNTATPGSLIRKMIAYMHGMLHLGADIYNLSVTGTFVDKTGQSVLEKYAGKTIIILCNPMDYFGAIGRVAYEFIDPWLVSRLLKAKTSILLLGLDDINQVTDYWGKMIAAPGFPIDTSGDDGSVHAQSIDELLDSFQDSIELAHEPRMDIRSHTVAVKKTMFLSFQTSTNRSGNRLAKQLTEGYPFQNYILKADYAEASKTNPAKIIIREGLSSDSTILASSIPCQREIARLPSEFQYLIAATIPFEKRLKMMWTGTFSREQDPDMKQEEDTKKKGKAKATAVEIFKVPEKIRQFIRLSVQYDVLRETANLCRKAPCPLWDPVCKNEINILLPLLSRVFSSARESGIRLHQISGDQREWLISAMGFLLAEADSGGILGGARGRKRMVKNFVRENMADGPVAGGLEAELEHRRPEVKILVKYLQKAMKEKQKKTQEKKDSDDSPVIIRTLNEIVHAVGGMELPFHDIGRRLVMSNPTSLWSEEQWSQALEAHLAFIQKMAADEARCRRLCFFRRG